MKRISLILIALFAILCVNAQINEDEIIYDEGEIRYGVVNAKGKEAIPFAYSALRRIDGSTSLIAQKDGQWGVIDNQGPVLLPFENDNISNIGDDLLIISKGKRYRILNYTTKEFFFGEYDYLAKESLAADVIYASRAGKMGVINQQGHSILPYAYDSLRYFSPTLFVASKAGKWGLVNRDNKPLGVFAYDAIGQFFNGELIMGKVRKGNKCGLMDDKRRIVLQPTFQDIMETTVADNFIAVRNGKYGVADAKGRAVINPVYDWIRAEKDGLYAAQKDGKVGLIDCAGKTLIAFEYDNLFKMGDLLVTQKDGYFGAINMSGKKILEDKYISLKPYPTYVIGMEREGFKMGLFDLEGQKLFPFAYNKIFPLAGADDLFVAYNQDLCGVVDIAGKVVLPLNYTSVKSGIGNDKTHFVVRKNNEIGVVDLKGKTIVPFRYTSIEKVDEDAYLVGRFFGKK